jgi:hypothetical protein
MTLIILGVLLLVACGVLFKWAIPKDGQPSPITQKWGMGTMLPIVVMCLGFGGIILVIKGMFP